MTNVNATEESKKWLKQRLIIWGISLPVLLILAVVFAAFHWYSYATLVTLIAPLILLIGFISYRFIHYWYDKFIDDSEEDLSISLNPYRKIFFSGVNLMAVILLAVGFIGAFLIVDMQEEGSLYQAVGLMIMIIWAVIFLRYFVWALYFYNINYGYTDKDWIRIFKARKDKAMGIPILEGSEKGPPHNPYRSQTFGLPPGTVRGMIAFTLLFGAIALTITSMGLNSEIDTNTFYWDHYEFFKTAFLMMIAFYFGDSSLRYLSKRWNATREISTKTGKTNGDTPDDVELSEADFEHHEQPSETEETKTLGLEAFKIPSKLRKLLEKTGIEKTEALKTPVAVKLEEEYPQIADHEKSKLLGEDDYYQAAQVLKDKKYDIRIPVVKAIVQVESSSSGFLDDGRAKILFEGHKFWYWLKELNVTDRPETLLAGNEDILYEKWTREHYKGGKGEYDRLYKAMNINKEAAIYSTSWGKFQILGENLKHNIKSRINASGDLFYRDFMDFYEKQHLSEYYHLLDFIAFITTKKVDNEVLASYIIGEDPEQFNWEKFAEGYNGKGYKKNNYDTKLKRAYEYFS